MLDREAGRIGRFAWVMAWVGLVVGQLHALARFATADGKEDLEVDTVSWWAVPTADALSPLLEWADPDIVYVTYGKIWFPAFLAFTLCAAVVYRRRQPGGFEKWAWRGAIAAYVVATVGVFLDYWTQWTGSYHDDGVEAWFMTVGWYVTVPGLMLMLICSTVLGGTLLVRRFRPLVPALLLLLVVPLGWAILMLTSLGSVALPVMLAFGILGRRVARSESDALLTRPDPAVAERVDAA